VVHLMLADTERPVRSHGPPRVPRRYVGQTVPAMLPASAEYDPPPTLP